MHKFNRNVTSIRNTYSYARRKIIVLIVLVIFLLTNLALAKDLGVIKPYLILGGTQGSMIEQFNEPDAVAFTRDGRLLAGDTQNGRFKIYSISERSLSIVTIGEPGTGDCQFDNSLAAVLPSGRRIYNEVQGIVCNSKDEILVVDQGNRRIQIFDAKGTCLTERTINLASILVKPDSDNGTSYTSIQGITVDELDNIYVTDTGTRRVYKFLKNGSQDMTFKFQVKEKNNYILLDPESMVIHNNKLLIADEGNQIIKVYEKNTGRFTGQTIGHPDLFGRDVEGLAIYQDKLFALNEESGQVIIFDLTKDDTPVIGFFGEKGLTPGRFLSPDGLAVSRDGRYLAIADQGNFRIQVFELQNILNQLK
ncbi:MAG: hypothetical protein E2O76_13510 [Caldithrix sp.]|nr:MAG: hypothetical protein E2O76_13510 [Caldithrix sp.]